MENGLLPTVSNMILTNSGRKNRRLDSEPDSVLVSEQSFIDPRMYFSIRIPSSIEILYHKFRMRVH